MKAYIQSGFKLRITAEWTDISTLSEDTSIRCKPPELEMDTRIVTEEGAISAVKEYFKRYNELSGGHEV